MGLGITFSKMQTFSIKGSYQNNTLFVCRRLGISPHTKHGKIDYFHKEVLKVGKKSYKHCYFVIFEGLTFMPNQSKKLNDLSFVHGVNKADETLTNWLNSKMKEMTDVLPIIEPIVEPRLTFKYKAPYLLGGERATIEIAEARIKHWSKLEKQMSF